MINLDSLISVNPQVVDTELQDNETVLLHLETKLYFSLNSTGTRIWKGLKNKLTLKQISGGLQQKYHVEQEQAESSVVAFVNELYNRQLVQHRE